MITNREYESLKRVGLEENRSYYIPYGQEQKFAFKNRILDRKQSNRFISSEQPRAQLRGDATKVPRWG